MHLIGEHRRGVQQIDAHPDPLRPLAGKHKHRLAYWPGTTHDNTGAWLTVDKAREPLNQLRPVGAHHHRPMFEHRPGGSQRPAHIGYIEIRAITHPLRQAPCLVD